MAEFMQPLINEPLILLQLVVSFSLVITLVGWFRAERKLGEEHRQKLLLGQEVDNLGSRIKEQEQQLLDGRMADGEQKLEISRLKVVEGRWQDDRRRLESLESKVESLQGEYQTLSTSYESERAQAKTEKAAMEEKLELLKAARKELSQDFELLSQKIFTQQQQVFNEQSQQTLKHAVDPLRDQLTQFRKKVEDVYDKESAQRNSLMGRITELQLQTQKIGEDAVNLTRALKGDNKAQGNWGEVVLERLLEESGLQKGREYELQVALADEDGKRRNPDAIIRLPEGKDIVIDSKVSLVHYEQYCRSEDDDERSQLLKHHIGSLRTHVNQLSLKSYEKLEGIRSLDFVFIFVPVEAAFLAAAQSDMQLFSDAYNKQVIIVSPTTLLATLRTVENLWRFDKQNKNAAEIAALAGGLYDQFVLFTESLESVGTQIGKANDAYQLAHKRLATGRGNLLRRAEAVKKLGAKTKKQLSDKWLNQDINADDSPVLSSVDTEGVKELD